MNIFKVIYQSYNSIVATTTSTLRSIEKTMRLIENELDHAKKEQADRLCNIEYQRLLNLDQMPVDKR